MHLRHMDSIMQYQRCVPARRRIAVQYRRTLLTRDLRSTIGGLDRYTRGAQPLKPAIIFQAVYTVHAESIGTDMIP